MTELQSNGNYESYLAQLFNPQMAGGNFNPAFFNPQIGGPGNNLAANAGAFSAQNPWAMQNPWALQQNLPQVNAPWTQQGQGAAQNLATLQAAQQVAARHAAQAIQNAQVLQQLQQQALYQLMQTQGQQSGQYGQLGQYGQNPLQQNPLQALTQNLGGHHTIGANPFGLGYGQPNGFSTQNVINQLLQQQAQQQALQQLINALAATQGGQYRYGMAA